MYHIDESNHQSKFLLIVYEIHQIDENNHIDEIHQISEIHQLL